MDDRRFDELTKALVAAKPSRREALRRLAGGALATVFAGVAFEGASAQRVGIAARTCGQRCESNGQCNAGLQCGETTRRCFAIPDSREPCTGNGDCDLNYETCNRNERCINTVAPSDCDECEKTGDCEGSDTICSNRRCIERECTVNSDCPHPNRQRCRQGRCVNRN
jgi:hypothetical protein